MALEFYGMLEFGFCGFAIQWDVLEVGLFLLDGCFLICRF